MSQEMYDELTEILRDVFDNDALVATPDLDASQVPDWDSLGNVRLFLSIEMAFGVRFSAGEISGIDNLGDLVKSIEGKLA
jgi:acyl carrier protein